MYQPHDILWLGKSSFHPKIRFLVQRFRGYSNVSFYQLQRIDLKYKTGSCFYCLESEGKES